MSAAGGVEHHDVEAAEPGRLQRAAGDLHGRLAGDDRQGVDADLLAEHGELFHRGRAAGVEGGHQHPPLAAVGEARAILAVVVVLPEPCRPTIRIADRRRGVEVDRLGLGAEHLDELVVDDLHDLLAGRDRLDHLGADRAVRAPCR